MMTLYYLTKEFGLWYLMGLPLVFMVTSTVSMLLSAKLNRYVRLLLVLGWPVAVPVLYVLCVLNVGIRAKLSGWFKRG